MRMITGAILTLAAVQAFAHAHSGRFPDHVYVKEVLLPTSLVLALFGIAFLTWGAITDRRRQP